MHQSPQSWKREANAWNAVKFKQQTSKTEGEPLLQDAKSQNGHDAEACANSVIEKEADGEGNHFAQCHHHLHTINACVEYQQAIKDEMKRLVKLENAIYQKTLSHAQRLARISSGMSPDPAMDWMSCDLDALADHVALTAQAHYKNAVMLSGQCAAVQQALDNHHELMRRLHGHRHPKKASASGPSFLPSPADDRNDEWMVPPAERTRRLQSPRKITTLAVINTKEDLPSQPSLALETTRTLSSPDKVCRKQVKDATKEAIGGKETGENGNLRSHMSFMHAHCQFEDIRKRRLVLTNEFEFMRTQQISIEKQLRDEEQTILYLQENTPNKHRPWNTQVRLEESLSLREFLQETAQRLERQTKEAMNELEDFDLLHRDKLSDILKVFTMHRRGHYQNLKHTLAAIRSVFFKGQNFSGFSEELGDGVTGNQKTLESNSWNPNKNNALPMETHSSIPVQTETATSCERAISDRPCAASHNNRKQRLPSNHVGELISLDETFNVSNVYQISELDHESSPDFPSREVLQPARCSSPSKITPPVQGKSSKDLASSDASSWGHYQSRSPKQSTDCKPSSSSMGNTVSVQVDFPPLSPRQKRRLKKDMRDTAKISPELRSADDPPDAAARKGEEAANSIALSSSDSSPQYLDDDDDYDYDVDKSSSVGGIGQSPKQFFRGSLLDYKCSEMKRKNDHNGGTNINAPYFEKFSKDRDIFHPDTDKTNNHERALLEKYVFAKTLSPQDLRKREKAKGNNPYRRELVGNLNGSNTEIPSINGYDWDSDIEAQHFIGKYATKSRRSHFLEQHRMPTRDRFPFRTFKFLSKNNREAQSQRNLNNNDVVKFERHNTSASTLDPPLHCPSEKRMSPGHTILKEAGPVRIHNVGSFSVGSGHKQTGNNNRAATKKESDSILKNDSSSSTIADSGHLLSVTTECSPKRTEQKSEKTAVLKFKVNKRIRDPDNFSPRHALEVRECNSSACSGMNKNATDSNQDTHRGQSEESLGVSTITASKADDLQSSVTPDEARALSDESEWETESISTLTNTSMSSCHSSLRKSADIGPLSALKPNDEESNNMATTFPRKPCTAGTRTMSSVKDGSVPQPLKKVRFDDEVQYNNGNG